MQNKTIAILENRSGKQLADLVLKYGGTPISAPALSEVPDIDLTAVETMVKRWQTQQPDLFIFQTGVGTKALFNTLDQLHLSQSFLEIIAQSHVVVRGPKPTAVLRSRAIRIDQTAGDPYTTNEVLGLIEDIDLHGKSVVVQRYGDTNLTLQTALKDRGANVSEVATYRWQLPTDIQPLLDLMQKLHAKQVDMVCFTSASQVDNFFKVAEDSPFSGQLQSLLNDTAVASIGPVCSKALDKYAVDVALEASPPKLGPFIKAINAHFA